MILRLRTGLLALISFLSLVQVTFSQDTIIDGVRYITYTEPDSTVVYLEDNRKPSLYTQNFGDCSGGSTINLTRFDAAYYADNMTVLFHFEGNSGLANETVMMYIGVFAYGQDRFDLVFNPCSANINSLCPVNSSLPIEAQGYIPVSQSDVANIPPIALSIPDFEGEAILRIFSNRTHEEIACYSAVVTNGASFSQPEAVGSVLGVFTFVALLASFATAIYGEAVPTMRVHYAHSLSVSVVFAVWQHIFFSGALSVNWPSVLPAWWSNFAWAGGMIYSGSMQGSINNFVGNNIGNTSQVGAAQAGSPNSGVGGGYDISLIYKRMFRSGVKRAAHHPRVRNVASRLWEGDHDNLLKRAGGLADASTGYTYYGKAVGPGLPLPGNYSGFAGTLAPEEIRTSNAFMTGFLWFLIALVLLVACVMAFKWLLEGLARVKWIREDRLRFFRDHWLGYSAVSALRICLIAWFMIMFLTIFQFTFESTGGVVGVAAVVFIIFFVGLPAVAGYAYWYKRNVTDTANHLGEHNILVGGKLPIPRFGRKKTSDATVQERGAQHDRGDSKGSDGPLWKRVASSGGMGKHEDNGKSIHDDEDYIMKFGWLASRFRRTRWWFFAAWMFYDFLRAIFYGGASGYAQAQVFGLLVVEIIAFGFIVWARPFEGQRLNILVVYCLGFSKVTTVGLSAAFDVKYNVERITATAIGIVIIVIQGILTIITLIAIIVGAISSYMSVSRNRDDFRPRKWHGLREKYFDHLDRTVNDVPREPKPKPEKKKKKSELPPEEIKEGFEMKNIRRERKIEDDDEAFASEMRSEPNAVFVDAQEYVRPPGETKSTPGTPVGRSRPASRAFSVASVSSTQLPWGARPHRPSWSTRDFSQFDASVSEPGLATIDMTKKVDEDEPLVPQPSAGKNIRTPSRSATMPAKLGVTPSTDSLHVGGEVSTLNMIGKVPAPSVRPRSDTRGSMHGSLHTVRSTDFLGADLPESQPPSQRTSANYGQPGSSYGRGIPLTPAQEVEEFIPMQRTISRRD